MERRRMEADYARASAPSGQTATIYPGATPNAVAMDAGVALQKIPPVPAANKAEPAPAIEPERVLRLAGDARPDPTPPDPIPPASGSVAEVKVAVLSSSVASDQQKIEACDALGALGPSAEPTAKALVHALSFDRVRNHAKAALKAIGPSAAEALLLGTESETGAAFDTIAELLRGLPPDDIKFLVPAIKNELQTGSTPFGRANAARKLGAIGPMAGDSFSLLIEALHDRETVVATQAFWALDQVRPNSDLTIPRILVQLSGPSQPGHAAAAEALAKISDAALNLDSYDLTSAMVGALGDPDPVLRATCAAILKKAGEHTASAIPKLLENIRSSDDARNGADAQRAGRYLSASVLVHLGPAAKPAVPEIVKMMVDPGGAPRELPELMLLKMGPVAAAGLQDAIKSPDPKIQVASAGILADLYPCEEATGRALSDAMHDQNEAVRQAAATALARCAPTPSAMSPVLAAAVQDANLVVRDAAVEALAVRGFDVKDAPNVAALVAILSEDDNVHRLRAAAVLGRIGPPASDAIPALTRMAGNRQSHVRRGAAQALVKIDPQGKRLGPALLAAVQSGDTDAVRVLGGCVRAPLEPKLSARLADLSAADPDPAVRAAATDALRSLRSATTQPS
jgi:HEAT repeat protein